MSRIILAQLSDILDIQGEKNTLEILESFHCKRDPDREDYLHNKAVMMEKKCMSRTYIAINEEGIIMGFFSVGMKCMKVPDNVVMSNTTRKKMNIDKKTGVAQSYLLGQIGRDDCSPKGFGEYLLTQSLDRLTEANRIVGCRTVRLDCTDALIPYYQNRGFIKVNRNEADSLNQMAVLI